MKKYYLVNTNNQSGITDYAKNFHELVLSDFGYELINPFADDLYETINPEDDLFFEIGVNSKKEVELLFQLLKKNYSNISITLHDAPLLRYPYFKFKNNKLEKLSKFIHVYMRNFGLEDKYFNKIKNIFVLNDKAKHVLESKYNLKNVYKIPHIIDHNQIEKPVEFNNNFIFFGFIGKNKGLDYAFMIHHEILKIFPDSIFYIIGKPMDRANELFLKELLEKYPKNTKHLGYLDANEMKNAFDKASCVLLPFKEYKYYYPTSGSVINSLKLGKIVFTTQVNAINELIEDGKTGFILKNDLAKDIETIKTVLKNKEYCQNIVENSSIFLHENLSSKNVKSKLESIIK